MAEDDDIDKIKKKLLTSLKHAMDTAQKFLMSAPPDKVKENLSKWDTKILEKLMLESKIRENYEICSLVKDELDKRKKNNGQP